MHRFNLKNSFSVFRSTGITAGFRWLWPSIAAAALGMLFAGNLFAQTDQDMKELEDLLNTKIAVASKKAEKLSDAPAMISVITKDEIKRFGGTTLADILNRVPGLIHIGSYFTDRSMVVSRGDAVKNTTSNRHVLLLFDGRPVREVQEGGIKCDVYESFPVSAIDHIEVIKGPGSVLYGSEAFSAVINVVTVKPEANGVDLAAALGEAGAHNESLNAKFAKGEFSMLLAARESEKSNFPVTYGYSSVDDGPVEATENFTMQEKATSLFVKSNYKGFGFTGSFMKYRNGYMIADYLSVYGNLEWKKAFFDGGYDFDITDKWSATANITYNRSWFDNASSGVPNVKRDSHETLLEMTHFYSFNDKAKLTAGGLFSRAAGTETDKDSNLPTSHGARNSVAGYAQLDYRFVETAKAVGGFQILKVGEAKTTMVPRLGLVWNPRTDVNFKVLYAQAFRAPYINENFINFGNFLLGNKQLKPEKVSSYEVSANYLKNNLEFSIGYFRNHQSDIITFQFQPEANVLKYVNLLTSKIQGVETSGKFYLNRSVFITGSLLYQQATENGTTGIPDFGAKMGISYSGEKGLISLFNVYQGEISEELYNQNSTNPKPEPYNLLSLHASLNLNKVFKWKGKTVFEAYIQGDNMLDKEIWIYATGDSMQAQFPFNPGRTLYFGLKLNL